MSSTAARGQDFDAQRRLMNSSWVASCGGEGEGAAGGGRRGDGGREATRAKPRERMDGTPGKMQSRSR